MASKSDPIPDDASLKDIQHTLITANHILHHNHVVDAYGHISVRHPTNPDWFIMSGSMAPALVSSPADLVTYRVEDALPVEPNVPKGYQERFIHSEILKRYPDVNSVVHSHSTEVLPFAVGNVGVQMAPVFHIAGFLGSTGTPVWNIAELYTGAPGERRDLLVKSEREGAALAKEFAGPGPEKSSLANAVVLMRSHGFSTVGKNIKQAVFRAVYTHINAGVQSKAILLNGAGAVAAANSNQSGDLVYLNDAEVEGCSEMGNITAGRPWGLWEREVEANPLYVNRA